MLSNKFLNTGHFIYIYIYQNGSDQITIVPLTKLTVWWAEGPNNVGRRTLLRECLRDQVGEIARPPAKKP